jgi:hypothetical protein
MSTRASSSIDVFIRSLSRKLSDDFLILLCRSPKNIEKHFPFRDRAIFFGAEHMESEEHLRKMLPPEVVAQQPE